MGQGLVGRKIPLAIEGLSDFSSGGKRVLRLQKEDAEEEYGERGDSSHENGFIALEHEINGSYLIL